MVNLPGRKVSTRFPMPIHSSNPVIRYIQNQQQQSSTRELQRGIRRAVETLQVPHDQRYISPLWIPILVYAASRDCREHRGCLELLDTNPK
jgi:hypothetical protein